MQQAEQQRVGLQSALEKMEGDYTLFLEKLREQRQALVSNQRDCLTSIATDLETIADGIFLMDDRRRMHMEVLAEMVPCEALSLEALAQAWPSLDFSGILSTARRLRQRRAELERAVAVNAALIQSSRNLNQVLIEALLRKPATLKTPAQRVYGANGAMKSDLRANTRNLLNRKG